MNTKVKKTNSRNKTKKKNQSRNKQTKKKQSKKIQSKKIQSKTKQSKIGGFFFTPTNTGISSQIKKSVITENNLIHSYEKMSNSISDYYDKYDNHLRNLISIDDFANFDSMEKLFKDEIINKHFKDSKKIDKSNPLLLRNYLVDGISTPSSFRKEHLIKQIRYKLYYNFSDRERQLIIDVNIKLVDNESIAMIIRTIENKVYKKSIQHKNYNLDLSQVEESLANIIKETKESLGYKNNILKQKPKNNNTKNNSNNFEFQNNVVENSDLIFRNNNNKNNNNKNTKKINRNKNNIIKNTTSIKAPKAKNISPNLKPSTLEASICLSLKYQFAPKPAAITHATSIKNQKKAGISVSEAKFIPKRAAKTNIIKDKITYNTNAASKALFTFMFTTEFFLSLTSSSLSSNSIILLGTSIFVM